MAVQGGITALSSGHPYPVRTGLLSEDERHSVRHAKLHNHGILTVCAASLVTYSFAIYGVNSGHFVANTASLPIQVALAAGVRPSERAMFKEYKLPQNL